MISYGYTSITHQNKTIFKYFIAFVFKFYLFNVSNTFPHLRSCKS